MQLGLNLLQNINSQFTIEYIKNKIILILINRLKRDLMISRKKERK